MPMPATQSLRLALALASFALAPSGADAQARRAAMTTAVDHRELTATEQLLHTLNRLAFGPRPGDVERVRAMGVDRWIAAQLAPERLADSAGTAVLRTFETLDDSSGSLARAFETVRRARQSAQRDAAREGDTTTKREIRRDVLRENDELRDIMRQVQRTSAQLQSAKVARAVVSERQLQEVIVDFWANHFSVFAGKGVTRYYLPEYDRDVIRPHAFGKFRDLLGAVAKSPAMLFYLDNVQSRADSAQPTLAGAPRGTANPRAEEMRRTIAAAMRSDGSVDVAKLPPDAQRRWERMSPQQREQLQNGLRQLAQRRPRGLNENYARELLELHTLGVDGGYTQRDVIEVARALTGWGFLPRGGSGFVFRPEMHDAGEKVVLGQRLPAGRGIEDGEQVLDIVARHPSTSRFIARKLAVRFVSDTPPSALVERAAKVFRDTDGDIRETVRAIVKSPEFFSRAAYRAKVKTPFEVVVSAMRALGAEADTTPRTAMAVARLGQPIYGRQTPDGWPDRGDAWMNTGAILNRINFGLAAADGQLPGASIQRWPHNAQLASASRSDQVDGVVRALLGGDASPVTRQVLMSGDNPLLEKLARDSAAVRGAEAQMRAADTTDDAAMNMNTPRRPARGMRAGAAQGRPPTLAGLAQIVGLALGSPEFQRR